MPSPHPVSWNAAHSDSFSHEVHAFTRDERVDTDPGIIDKSALSYILSIEYLAMIFAMTGHSWFCIKNIDKIL
jgi:hypothetical protein